MDYQDVAAIARAEDIEDVSEFSSVLLCHTMTVAFGFTRLAQMFHEGQKHAMVLNTGMRAFSTKQPRTSQPLSFRSYMIYKIVLTSY